jgi:hypothetical protein
MAILDPESFLPIGTINSLRHDGAWGKDAIGWAELIEKLESSSISVIRAMINYSAIETDIELLTELLTLRIQAQLMTPLIHMQGMQESGEIALVQFNELIATIGKNQKDNGITTDERDISVPGLLVFN